MEYRRSSTYKRVWFITGSSDGIGRALTEAVLARGERVVVTARRPERVRDLIERYPAQALIVELDVTQHEQVHRAVCEAGDRFGRIDVLVNTTGRLFDPNVFGLVDVTREVARTHWTAQKLDAIFLRAGAFSSRAHATRLIPSAANWSTWGLRSSRSRRSRRLSS